MRRYSGDRKIRRPINALRPPGPTGTLGTLGASSSGAVTSLGYQTPAPFDGVLVRGAIGSGITSSDVVIDCLEEGLGLFGVDPVSRVADLYFSGHGEEFAHGLCGLVIDI